MSEAMHLLLKFNDNIYNVNTIAEHKRVLQNQGSVIWGLIKPDPDSKSIALQKQQQLIEQIRDGIPTYAFLASHGKITHKATVTQLYSNEAVMSRQHLVPEYYRKDLARCVLGFEFSSIIEMDSNESAQIKRYGGGELALSNQTNPLPHKKTTSNNISENRFVKYMIINTIRSITKLDRILKTIYPDAAVKYNLKEKEEKLSRYIGTYFQNISELDGSKSLSLVFQMAPGYQDVYKYYQLLKKGLNLGCDLYTISPKRTHELYEYWCYLKIHNILKDIGYSPVSDGFIEAKNNGLYLSIGAMR